MADRHSFEVVGRAVVHTVFTARGDGDLSSAVDQRLLSQRRAAITRHPWTQLQQVHGDRVVVVDAPGAAVGATGDALVTSCAGAVMSVQVADCAPVLMYGPGAAGAVVGVVHVGWRGLLAGVVDSALEQMKALGATGIDWLMGPCITARAYEFSAGDLAPLSEVFGPAVVGRTDDGAPALDLRAGVCAAMARAGCGEPVQRREVCTTDPDLFSHRARGDQGRQVGAIWWERR